MRLTLRTMLAHMDGILEPDDDADIRQKISDSEFAQKLMHRTRDCTRRLRLRAPAVSGMGLGHDPNTVSEYLDNTMPDEQVADFEKVCLESDTHLAEVAAAHQILTLALGEPMEIEDTSRERMYGLPAVAEQAERDPLLADRHRGRRERPTVPDYLREPRPRRRLLPALGAILVAAVIVVALLAATGRMDPALEWAGIELPGARGVADATDATDTPGVPTEKPGDEPGTDLSQPGESDVDVPPADIAPPATLPDQPADEPTAEAVPVPAEVEPSEPRRLDTPPTEPMPTEPMPVEPTDVEPQPGPSRPEQPAVPGGDATEPAEPQPAQPDGGEGLEPAPMPPATENFPGPVQPDVPTPEAGAPATDTAAEPAEQPVEPAAPGEGPTAPPQATADVRPEPEPTDDAEPQQPLGRVISEQGQLLISYEPQDDRWERASMQSILKPNRPLLALPTFRPMLALTSGVSVQLIDGTQVQLQPTAEGEPPTLDVAFGQLTLHTLGQAGARCGLNMGKRSGVLTFETPDSGAALHVYRVPQPGADPTAQPAPFAAELWATRGTVVWQDETTEAPALELAAPARVVIRENSGELLPVADVQLPDWIQNNGMSWLDRRASPTMADEIRPDRPVELSLRELADGHRQREVRWLAVRSLGYLGEFGPMVRVLDNEQSKPVWNDYIEQLRQAVARDPDLAAGVREALVKNYGDDAPEMYRMLSGYSAEGLADGEAARLVERLDDDRLAIRLLAFWNLKEITGLGLYYQPEQSPVRRRQAIARWQDRLESGEIVRKAEQKTGGE